MGIGLFFIFLLGLGVGSFLNVLIYRLPRSISPLGGRSFCPKCKKKISWQDNIPLVSFVALGGKCRFCHSPIGLQYPIVELTTGVLFVLATYLVIRDMQYEISWGIFILISYFLFLVSSLIVVFFTDLKNRIIPDRVVYLAILVALLYLISSHQSLVADHFFAALGAGLFFLILYLLTRGKGMGFGDVKLAFLMGLVLGPPKLILALYLAFLTGAASGVILILMKKKKFGEQIPFGPFLSGSTLLTLFGGEEIIKWLTAHFF